MLETTIEIPVRADAYIASNNPNDNFGASTWLCMGYSFDSPNRGGVRILMLIDVSGIPSNAVIHSARFRICQHSVTPAATDPPMVVRTYHLVNPWNEHLVTWSQHQRHRGGVIDQSEASTAIGWLDVDITDLAKEWANAGITWCVRQRPAQCPAAAHTRTAGRRPLPSPVEIAMPSCADPLPCAASAPVQCLTWPGMCGKQYPAQRRCGGRSARSP